MPEYSVSLPDVEEEQDEIQGSALFSWKQMILGLLAGGRSYADEINEAIEEAYAER